MKFDKEQTQTIWSIVASILHLGNIEFDDKNFDSSGTPCIVIGSENFKMACDLLSINIDGLKKALLFKVIEMKVGGETKIIESPLPKKECVSMRDSLCRALYDKLFNWLVYRLNFTILPQEDLDKGYTNMEEYAADRVCIGLLDIFGFEKFKANSLE